jgi:hypothetical protein
VCKVRVYRTRMHHAVRLHERQHCVHLLAPRGSERGAGRARVHQRLGGAWQKTVVNEEVFFDVQLGIAPLQIACLVALDAVAQRQVLCTRRSAYRVGLHEAQFGDGLGQSRGRKQGARHGKATQSV